MVGAAILLVRAWVAANKSPLELIAKYNNDPTILWYPILVMTRHSGTEVKRISYEKKLPLGQAVHAALPANSLYVATGQIVHEAAPGPLKNSEGAISRVDLRHAITQRRGHR